LWLSYFSLYIKLNQTHKIDFSHNISFILELATNIFLETKSNTEESRGITQVNIKPYKFQIRHSFDPMPTIQGLIQRLDINRYLKHLAALTI